MQNVTGPGQESVEGRTAGFHAVEGGGQTRSGTVLVVEAYAVIWLVIFGFVWMSYRRQKAIEGRLTDLETALAERGKEK